MKSAKVGSEIEYPVMYRGPLSVEGQIQILRRHFPELRPPVSVGKKVLRPPGSEGLFVFFQWLYLGHNYTDATKALIRVMGISDYREYDTCTVVTPGTRQGLHDLFNRQGSNQILVGSGQFGRVRRNIRPDMLNDILAPGEVPLDLFTTLCWLLTHPGRISQRLQLKVLCAGSIIGRSGESIGTPAILYDTGGAQLICLPPRHSYHDFGVPTLFLPRS